MIGRQRVPSQTSSEYEVWPSRCLVLCVHEVEGGREGGIGRGKSKENASKREPAPETEQRQSRKEDENFSTLMM